MLSTVGSCLGIFFAASCVVGARGLGLFLARRWKAGIIHFVLSLLGLVGGVGLLFYLSIVLAVVPDGATPTESGRIVSATLLDLAYHAFWLILLGMPVALFVTIRSYRRASQAPTLPARE